MLTGTVRFVIAPGHPHYGKKLVVLGGVKFKNGSARVTAEDAAKIEPILVNFHNVAIEGSAQHEEFVRLYAGAADETDEEGKVTKKKTPAQKAKAIADAHEEIQAEKLDALMAVAMGDDRRGGGARGDQRRPLRDEGRARRLRSRRQLTHDAERAVRRCPSTRRSVVQLRRPTSTSQLPTRTSRGGSTPTPGPRSTTPASRRR
jgi:hypothetical protein